MLKLWIGDAKYGIICIWSLVDFEMKMRVAIECQGLTTMINIDEMVQTIDILTELGTFKSMCLI